MLDGEERKLGERTGLDTLVVLAVNDARGVQKAMSRLSAVGKPLSAPPGKYARKSET